MKRIVLFAVAVVLLLAWNASVFSDPGSQPHQPHPQPSPVLGTTLPSDFPVIINPYLGVPVLGFGASGKTHRALRSGSSHLFAWEQRHAFRDRLQSVRLYPQSCPIFSQQRIRSEPVMGSGIPGRPMRPHKPVRPTNQESLTARLRQFHCCAQFVHAVMKSTGARQVDIVAHSLGVTVAREWMFQDNAYNMVRSLVAIEGPNHGIIDCSPDPLNFFQLPADGGFIPTSAVCDEYGKEDTQLLTTLNAAGEAPGPTRYLVLRNIFRASPESGDFVYLSAPDGFFPAVPAEDSTGAPHDFSDSALLAGAPHMDFVGQGQFDVIIGTSHLGILNSPDAWSATFQFLNN